MSENKDKTVISEAPAAAEPATQTIGHYEVVAELGRGGMGTVYRGYESSLNRYVAIKVLAPHLLDDEGLVGRFSREAKSVAALNHPNIVHIYYTGEHDGQPYFVMECVEGDTLADLVREQGTLAPKQAAQLTLQMASGLGAAHDRGIIHRDVKPSNIMLDGAGNVKITDFGIALARDIGDKLTTTGQFVGTTGYVSPEVFQGRTVDSRSDIFSLGVVLYEMLAGTKPFDDESPMGLMLQVVEKPAPDVRELNPSVDRPLQQILMRMIEKDPADRYQTCHELMEDLKRYLAGQPLSAPAQALEPEVAPPPKRQRALWPALLLLLLVAGSAAGYHWRQPLMALAGLETVPEAAESVADEPLQSVQADDPPAPAGPPSAPKEPSTPAEPAVPPGNEGGPVVNEPGGLAGDPGEPEGDPLAGGKAGAADPVSEPVVEKVEPSPSPVAVTKPAQAAPTQAQDKPLPSAATVAVRGDPAVAGEIGQHLERALAGQGLSLLDSAFIPGATGELQRQQPDIALLRQAMLDAGGRYLIIATAEPLDAEALTYYGQVDTLYSAQLTVRAFDLLESRSLGRWSEALQYTSRNAADRAAQAVEPVARELGQALDSARE